MNKERGGSLLKRGVHLQLHAQMHRSADMHLK